MISHLRRRSARLLTALFLASPVACGDDEPVRPDAGVVCPANAAECAARGANCGRVDLPDGTCISCGTCVSGTETGGGGGQANVCGCTPRNCVELGFECGMQPSGCGGEIDCGVCLGGVACLGGRCRPILELEDRCDLTPEACDTGLKCCPTGLESACLTIDANGNCPAPKADIVLDLVTTRDSISFETASFQPTSCAISDGCIPGPGTYQLMRFATQIKNVGQVGLNAGIPVRDPSFVYDMCHMHYHYAGFVNYSLRAREADGSPGAVVAGGSKFSYCIEDVSRVNPMHPNSPEAPFYTCGDGSREQGLSVGWGDLYEAALDCQWVNITGVPAGDYFLELVANPDRKLIESRYLNNTLLVPVTIR